MARIRSVKPELFDDPDIGQLSAEATVVFIGLFTQADREGRMVDDPRRLKIRLRPYSTCDFDATLAELVDAGFIIRYQSEDGVRLLQVRSFKKHQRFHPDEKASDYPPPSETGKSHGKPGKPGTDNPVSCLSSLGSGFLSLVDSGEPAAPPSPPPVPVMEFDVTGDRARKTWPLTDAYLADLQRDYEHLDVLAECKKASAWVKANPGRKKTAKGMPAFLVRWLNNTANDSRKHVGATEVRPRHLPAPQPDYDRDDYFSECKRLHGNACNGQVAHALRMQIDAGKAQAAS